MPGTTSSGRGHREGPSGYLGSSPYRFPLLVSFLNLIFSLLAAAETTTLKTSSQSLKNFAQVSSKLHGARTGVKGAEWECGFKVLHVTMLPLAFRARL